MEYLPAEIQHKILKNLNYDELFTFKQTNRHFYEFINKYEECFARKKFNTLFFIASDYEMCNQAILSFNSNSVKDMANNFTLSNNLQEKWLSTLNKQIPICIVNTESIVEKMEDNILNGEFIFENTEAIAVRIEPSLFFLQERYKEKNLALKLPLFPKNIEELKIIRYWLVQIVRCDFRDVEFNDFILNPEMIKLLFDNEEISKLKFYCDDASIFFNNQNIAAWKFTFDFLVISSCLDIKFFEREEQQETIKEGSNFLLELLLNEGYRIPNVTLEQPNYNQIVLYNNLINNMETSKDLSKMVNVFTFRCECNCWPSSKLIVRGVQTTEGGSERYYDLTNIYDSKLMFSIFWNFEREGSNLIKKIEIFRYRD